MSQNACYFCGNDNDEILQEHHIVPRRFGGSDEGENLVDLCPNCHRGIERLYNKRFYDALGVSPEDYQHPDLDPECAKRGCSSLDTTVVSTNGRHMSVCHAHLECSFKACQRSDVNIVGSDESGIILVCGKHRVCKSQGCANTDVVAAQNRFGHGGLYCVVHQPVMEVGANGD